MNTCIVVGNGPSLKDIPDEWLKDHYTFGSNRCYLKFIPDVYACVNPLVVEQFKHEINEMDCLKYIDSNSAKHIINSIPVIDRRKPVFSGAKPFIGAAYTVTSVLLQIAYWHGFRRVGLVGVDHRYSFTGKPNEQHLAEAIDQNHFDPKYFSGVQWNNPDLERSELAYRLAKEAYQNAGGEIVNLTPNSDLDVFPFDDWSKW